MSNPTPNSINGVGPVYSTKPETGSIEPVIIMHHPQWDRWNINLSNLLNSGLTITRSVHKPEIQYLKISPHLLDGSGCLPCSQTQTRWPLLPTVFVFWKYINKMIKVKWIFCTCMHNKVIDSFLKRRKEKCTYQSAPEAGETRIVDPHEPALSAVLLPYSNLWWSRTSYRQEIKTKPEGC